MNTHADKTQENKSQSVANAVSQIQNSGESIFQFVDHRPEAIAQRKLQEMANNSPQAMQLRAFQEMANKSLQANQAAQSQSMANSNSVQQEQPIQKKENNTGLPNNLKTGMEKLSMMSLDDVKVHRNSDKPAQLHAHAYAQSTDIHLGPGQEKHLPHEARHVVLQNQGRVKPTLQMKGMVNVNDNAGLEKEADLMGERAGTQKHPVPITNPANFMGVSHPVLTLHSVQRQEKITLQMPVNPLNVITGAMNTTPIQRISKKGKDVKYRGITVGHIDYHIGKGKKDMAGSSFANAIKDNYEQLEEEPEFMIIYNVYNYSEKSQGKKWFKKHLNGVGQQLIRQALNSSAATCIYVQGAVSTAQEWYGKQGFEKIEGAADTELVGERETVLNNVSKFNNLPIPQNDEDWLDIQIISWQYDKDKPVEWIDV